MQKFVPRSRVRIFHNVCSRSTPLDPELLFWCISFYLGAFGTISLLHKTCRKTRQTGVINAKVRGTMSCWNFFVNNTLDPLHWTLNSCFGEFLSIWVHLEPFRYCPKLAAKRAKLVQLMKKFVPRSRVRIFCNEHSRFTPLNPKLMFWCVSFRLGAFGTISLLQETWCKTRQTGAINEKVRATKSCHNFSQRNLTIHTNGP